MASPLTNATPAGPSQPLMFKNMLQTYTQRLGLPLPAYRATNEGGVQHAPKFRSTVFVQGTEYTSKMTYPHLRDAEQDAAKLAYECLMSNTEQQISPKSLNKNMDAKSGKAILNELGVMRGWEIPAYNTELSEDTQVYISTVAIGDKIFTGEGGRNKREAEQLAAETALKSILGIDYKAAFNKMMISKKKRQGGNMQVRAPEFKQKTPIIIGHPVPHTASSTVSSIPRSAPRSFTATTQRKNGVQGFQPRKNNMQRRGRFA